MDYQKLPVVTVVLGAGASRDVLYVQRDTTAGYDPGPTMLSPLDRDFFDLLQQLEAHTPDGPDRESMRRVIHRVLSWEGEAIWRSMEKTFYSLHVSTVLEHKLFLPQVSPDPATQLVNDFLRCIRALLREAHGTRACDRHSLHLQGLYATDAIVTFNYDFVAEKGLAGLHGDRQSSPNKPFGDWFYAFSDRPEDAPDDVPTLYKLHGSLNWTLREDRNGEVRCAREDWPRTWAEFAKELDYSSKFANGYDAIDASLRPPILLPYWDKRIEEGMWLRTWKAAADQLRRTNVLVVWGYSLPATDLKARELFRLAFRPPANLRRVIVVDPSREVRDLWRGMFLGNLYWGFPSFDEFYGYSGLPHATGPDLLRGR